MSSQDYRMPSGSAEVDGWVSSAEASRLLGVSPRTVFRMADRGELKTRGWHAHLNFSRASVDAARQRGPAISLRVAARLLGQSTNSVRELVTAGELTSFANPKWPVFRLEVERYAHANSPAPERAGQLSTDRASKMLGLAVGQLRQLAAAGRVPSERDERGRYWFRREHLALYQRARAAAATAEQSDPTPGSPGFLRRPGES